MRVRVYARVGEFVSCCDKVRRKTGTRGGLRRLGKEKVREMNAGCWATFSSPALLLCAAPPPLSLSRRLSVSQLRCVRVCACVPSSPPCITALLTPGPSFLYFPRPVHGRPCAVTWRHRGDNSAAVCPVPMSGFGRREEKARGSGVAPAASLGCVRVCVLACFSVSPSPPTPSALQDRRSAVQTRRVPCTLPEDENNTTHSQAQSLRQRGSEKELMRLLAE